MTRDRPAVRTRTGRWAPDPSNSGSACPIAGPHRGRGRGSRAPVTGVPVHPLLRAHGHPRPLQTPAFARTVIEETIPLVTAEQGSNRLKVRLRRRHRVYDPADPLRLRVILDESTLRRFVGSLGLMHGQLKHPNELSAEPHITVQVLPSGAGAPPGVAGQFSLLNFADYPEAGVIYLEGSNSDIYLENDPTWSTMRSSTPACRPEHSAPITPGVSSPTS
ncbi:DUF5753 domain-containing protein [Streptomyces sp. NBC_00178]|uniref:DUF5753 domain-containing protein n=1 Tax=Streptomyces sp. NBC_00178 TaxID=2975672 RepID=UPI003FA737CB